jgi:crotonobetainyl-CoA:carnitine CoA-transferase CaiB-like acyl-CoA transferase
MTDQAPLDGIRVINIGGAWAGRVAAMLMADQGADVIEIRRPGHQAGGADPLLDRGKRMVVLDLKSEDGLAQARRLASGADIAIENMRPGAADRLGLGYDALSKKVAGLVYLSLPGFAPGDEYENTHAWEGVINATVGVFTDISSTGTVLGGRPLYTAIPMASAYGGVHGALGATLALLHSRRTGLGQRIVVPLADAVMSAMALLAARFEGQPERYNFPPMNTVMQEVAFPVVRDLAEHLEAHHVEAFKSYLASFAPPTFGHFPCADGQRVFVNAHNHVYQTRMFLEAIGVLDQLVAEGMVVASPYAKDDGNNLISSESMPPAARRRVRDLVSQRLMTRNARDWELTLRDLNVPVTVVQTNEEWLSRQPLKDGGVVTDIADPVHGQTRQPGRFLSIDGEGVGSPDLRPREDAQGDVDWRAAAIDKAAPSGGDASAGILDGLRVLDLSNVIAGPAAGRTLSEFGADVIRIDHPSPLAGPRLTMWFGLDVNQGKRAVVLDLKSPAGRAVFARMVADADVVLHNFLDGSAEKLGIGHAQLSEINPDIISCQISAWGGPDGGPLKDDPAFDPVLQAATGIMSRFGTPEMPMIHATASCVDYITGFTATLGIAQALLARDLGRGGSYVRTSLAMGAQLVQFPYMVDHDGVELGSEPSGQQSLGEGACSRLYQVSDGWVFVAGPSDGAVDLATALGADGEDEKAIAAAISKLDFDDLSAALGNASGFGAARVTTLEKIRDARTVDVDATSPVALNGGSVVMARFAHPGGITATLPLQTWHRSEVSPVRRQAPAPWPGAHTREVLSEAGCGAEEIDQLFDTGVAREGWPEMEDYLPG